MKSSVLVLALLLSGCAAAPGHSRTRARPAGPPRRIVSLVPSVTELLFELGVGPRVVGVTADATYPPQVRKLPKVGDITVNYERLLALKPDLVVTDKSFDQDDRRRLKQLGVPVLTLDSASLDGLKRSLVRLGDVCGRKARAHHLVEQFDAQIEAIRRRARTFKPRPTVFVEIWNHPLMTAGGGTFVSQLIELAGGRNIFAELKGYPDVSDEQVLARNPDVIVLTTSSRKQALERPGWSALKAARMGQVYHFDPDLLVRPTLRVEASLQHLQRCYAAALRTR